MRPSSFLILILAQVCFATEHRALWRQITPPYLDYRFHAAGSLFFASDEWLLVGESGTEWQVLPEFGPLIDVVWTGDRWYLLTATNVYWATEPDVWNETALTGDRLGHLVWTGNQLVVTSYDSEAGKTVFWTSSDGQDWRFDSELDGPALAFLLHLGDRLIGFGDDGSRFEQDPEAGWLEGTEIAPPLRDLHSNGQILVGLSQSRLTVSEDGRTWRFLDVGNGTAIHDLSFNGTQFATCGDLGLVGSSTDGETWAVTSVPTEQNRPATNVASVGSRYLVAAWSGIFLGVDDTWQELGPEGRIKDGLEIAGNLVVRHREALSTYSGGQWTTHGFVVNAKPVLWQDRVVVQNDDGVLHLSSDGLTWDTVDTGIRDLGQVTAGNGILMSISTKGVRHASSDGQHWSSLNLPNRSGLFQISHGNGVYLARNGQGTLFRSTDAFDWSPVDRSAAQIVFGKGIFLTTVDRSVFASRNGRVWRQAPLSERPGFDPLLWTGSYFTSGGLVSEDGVAWVPLPQISEQVDFTSRYDDRWLATGIGVWLLNDPWTPTERPTLRSAVIPWVVSNQVWRSRIAFANGDTRPAVLTLEAVPDEGDAVTTVLELAPDSIQSFDADALFPGMTRYALYVDSDRREVYVSFLTINTEERSGGHSPSQTTAVDITDFGSQVAFGYTPGDQVSAIVLLTSYHREHDVTLMLHSGTEVLDQTQVTLSPRRPFAALVTDLFPDAPADAAITARAAFCDRLLAGTTFVFNREGQPSMAASLRTEEDCR